MGMGPLSCRVWRWSGVFFPTRTVQNSKKLLALIPFSSPWSNYNLRPRDTDYMAELAGRFAAGSIAIRDIFGASMIQIPGQQAWVGVLLKVKWIWLVSTHQSKLPITRR